MHYALRPLKNFSGKFVAQIVEIRSGEGRADLGNGLDQNTIANVKVRAFLSGLCRASPIDRLHREKGGVQAVHHSRKEHFETVSG